MDERSRLQREIAYYTSLINAKRQETENNANLYNKNRNNSMKYVNSRRTVIKGDSTISQQRTQVSKGELHAQSSRRTVVSIGTTSGGPKKRIVVASTSVNNTQPISTKNGVKCKNIQLNSAQFLRDRNSIPSTNSHQSVKGKSSKFVWRRDAQSTESLSKKATNLPSLKSKEGKLETPRTCYQVNSRFKLLKADVVRSKNTAKPNSVHEKIIDICHKTDRQTEATKPPNYASVHKQTPRSGRSIVSRYKIRKGCSLSMHKSQKPRTKPVSLAMSFNRTMSKSPYNYHKRKERLLKTKYKIGRYKIDRLEHKRKKVLFDHKLVKAVPKSPTAFKWVRGSMTARPSYVSPFKLVRRSTVKEKSKEKAIIRRLASRALYRSAATSIKSRYKKNNTNDRHCLFFMRFGKCSRGKRCFYIHDPARVAVCRRYLRGTCDIVNCSFSHEAKKEKVPVCQHFLRGTCLRENCPYLHVNVGKNAPICRSFAESRYCYLGEKCKKLHTDVCPNRNDNGSCPMGSKCKLRHPKRPNTIRNDVSSLKLGTQTRRKDSDSSLALFVDKRSEEVATATIPSGTQLINPSPSFISLSSVQEGNTANPAEKPKRLKTKPSFLQ